MSKAYYNDRGAAERAVLYGRTHREQKPSNDSQIVKLLMQVRDRLADIERERSELWETVSEQDKKLAAVDDRSNSTEKTFISLENRLSRSELQEAPLIDRLSQLERAQKEAGSGITEDLRSEILGRLEESDMQTARMIERIDESMAMQTRMARRIDKVVQDKQKLSRKLEQLEENMEATKNALASKALVLLSNQDLVTKITEAPKIPSFPTKVLKDDDEDEADIFDATESRYKKEGASNRADSFRADGLLQKAQSPFIKQGVLAASFVLVALFSVWMISHFVNPQIDSYAAYEAQTDFEMRAPSSPPPQVISSIGPPMTSQTAQEISNLASIEDADFQRRETEIAERLNSLEPGGALPRTDEINVRAVTAEPAIPAEPMTEASAKMPEVFAADEGLPASFKTLEVEAFKGNAEAQHDLGAIYTAGHGGVPQNYERAAYWFEKASDQGVANARYNLGVLYHQGMGVEQDMVQAIGWYQKAAQLGHPEAQYNLGIAHIEGIGVEYSPEKAAEFFEAAAASGIPESAFNLGLIYENGLIGNAQPSEALLWYKTAADLGNADARSAMLQLAKAMNIPESQIERYIETLKTPNDTQSRNVFSSRENDPLEQEPKNLVMQIQEQLGQFGLYPGQADGELGPMTSDAIRLYQSRNDIVVTGEISEDLLVHMLTKNLRNNAYNQLGSRE